MEHEQQRGLVWIVEDSPLEAEMARRALAATQDIEVISDGSLALERFAAGIVPDVVVLDWQLPTVTGVEVCRVLRTTHDANALPILMLTVQGRKQDIAFAIDAGANDYVTKPYDVSELVARVQTLVRTSRLQRAQVRRARQLELTSNVGTALTSAFGIGEIAKRCAEILAAHFDVPLAGVWVAENGKLSLAVRAGRDPAMPVPDGVVEECGASRTVLHRDGVAAVPLVLRDEVVGALAVVAATSGARDSRTAENAAILSTVADLVALGVARARAEEERADLLEREQAARAEAEEANRSKDEFLAMVSHELRTPLNAITGWASMLSAGTLDRSRRKRAVETIERNARAQKQLVEDLLDVTRIVSGKLRIERGRLDVASIVELALESVRPSAEAKGLELVSEISPNLPVIIGDAERVQQIVWNLLTNAIKFTPENGRVTLTVSVDGGAVRIVVTDTGVGITPEFLPHVFERFRQADASATRPQGGLGLGLAIVRHLVGLHGGTIEAKSDGLGKGATFSVRLPIETERPLASSKKAAADANIRDPAQALQGVHVLVVDDEADARELLKTLLEIYGIVVTTSPSAADAFEVFRKRRPDVLVSDVAMPREDGLSLMRRVRALPEVEGGAVPSIALTAYARETDRANALKAGFTSHVAKPVNANELFDVLTSLVARGQRRMGT